MTQPTRLQSLDVFRGATIAAMIVVNNPGSWDYVYAQLRHAEWHGWTITDWIFPFFLFIVGVAVTFSFSKRVASGDSKWQLFKHALWRSAILFALGLLINGFPFGLMLGHEFSWSTFRIPGVLQRIAICYLIASAIFLTTDIRGQSLWLVSFLVIYWLLIKLVPVPGYGAGVLEPTGNLGWYLDSTLMTGHTWEYAPAKGFDPEGIISTLPAIATTLFGILAGHWLRGDESMQKKTVGMLAAGAALLVVGWILDQWLPINKNLWTSTFAIFMAGWALLWLGAIYWVVDIKGWRRGSQPFVIFGMNAIVVFVLSELLAIVLWVVSWTKPDGSVTTWHDVIHDQIFVPLASPKFASLLFALTFLLSMYFVAWSMWKKRWFVKI
jgi:predicted acyltransferase